MIYVDNNSEYVIFPNLMNLEVNRIKGIVTNNVTNQSVIGYGSNSSDNELYIKVNFAEGWLEQFPDNEYTVELFAIIDNEDQPIGQFLVQKGINTTVKRDVFENDVTYIQFD